MKSILYLTLVVCTSALNKSTSYEEYVRSGGLPLPEKLRTGDWYNPGQDENLTFVVGGESAKLTNAPWVVSLAKQSHFCGGSVLTKRTILTAAHCINGKTASSLKVRVGSERHASGGTLLTVSQIIPHRFYNRSDVDYDIALIITSRDIPIGQTVRAVSLPSSEPSTGASMQVAGWGTTSQGTGSLPSTLRKVNINIIGRGACNNLYGGGISARMICAGVNGGGKDSCQGDSGGPLTLNGVQYGVVSWGRGCAQAGFPGVYTNVAVFTSWINANKV